jgi:hypothetical protein
MRTLLRLLRTTLTFLNFIFADNLILLLSDELTLIYEMDLHFVWSVFPGHTHNLNPAEYPQADAAADGCPVKLKYPAGAAGGDAYLRLNIKKRGSRK